MFSSCFAATDKCMNNPFSKELSVFITSSSLFSRSVVVGSHISDGKKSIDSWMLV